MNEEISAKLVGRRIVTATTAGDTFPDGSESTDSIMLELDDGQEVHFVGVWRNDTTAGVEWEAGAP